jgi:hypothetical protein
MRPSDFDITAENAPYVAVGLPLVTFVIWAALWLL